MTGRRRARDGYPASRHGWDDDDDDTTVLPRITAPVVESRRERSVAEQTLAAEVARRKRARRAAPEATAAPDEPRSARRRASAGNSESRTTDEAKPTRAASKAKRPADAEAKTKRSRRRRNRGRGVLVLALVLLVAVVGAGGYVAFRKFRGPDVPKDFAGPAGELVVVQVNKGDTAQQIAKAMEAKGVVASSGAFYGAAVADNRMPSVQPGYYAVPSHSPAKDAVAALVNPQSRVGRLVLSDGRQLHDSRDVSTRAVKEGTYRKIAAASCIGAAPAAKCVTYEQLNAAGAGDPAALGVPDWALEEVRKVPDRTRQLEGLIAAGTLDFDPSGTPEQILRQLVSASAAGYASTGIANAAAQGGLSPYKLLIAASLVEREALPPEMSKVARVILNRLAVPQKLEFDSTVNYSLDSTEVATTNADRARVTPWNTYAMVGLPATPISSPSLNALRAVEKPEPGPWLYFVTVTKEGATNFTHDYREHLRNVELAKKNGVLDSGR